jgi:hypothetical protein
MSHSPPLSTTARASWDLRFAKEGPGSSDIGSVDRPERNIGDAAGPGTALQGFRWCRRTWAALRGVSTARTVAACRGAVALLSAHTIGSGLC